MSTSACCICSSILDTYDPKTEKAIVPDRFLPCCNRAICTRCINTNPRYRTYCPYCQISTAPTSLPQGLRDPPPYDPYSKHMPVAPSALPQHDDEDDSSAPPAYSSHAPVQLPSEKAVPAQDVLHFLHPTDSMPSLSLAYGVPLPALRKHNNVHADHLLRGRKTLLIPGAYYTGGVSLSPSPVESEEEERRKTRIRRWMVACKCADYDVAVLYLEQSVGDVEEAVQAYRDDERWERENPVDGRGKGKGVGKRRLSGGGKAGAGMRRFVGVGAGS